MAQILKRFLPRALFGRALLIIVTPVVALQLVATFVFYERHWDTVTRRLSLGLAGDTALIIEMMRDADADAARDFTSIFGSAERYMSLRLMYLPNEILPNQPPEISVTNRIVDRMLNKAFEAHLYRPFRIDTTSYGEDIEIRVQLPDGVLRVLTTRKRVTSSTTYIFIMWMVGTSLVLLAVAILFLRNQIRPIRRLAEAADEFGKGRNAGYFHPSGATEVRQAAAAFISMRDRIQRQIAQRTEMLAGVSHDLRTPLTRMKLQLAMLNDSDDIQHLKADVSEMERMVEGYLAFMRGQDSEAVVDTDIGALISGVVFDAGRKGAKVRLAPAETVSIPESADNANGNVIPLRPNAIRRCLTNLVDNAARHGEHVEISVSWQPDQIEIAVDDDGPGIPEDRRDEVFRPFHRLEEFRNPETGGMGLGLAIARDVAHNHGGDIELSSSPLGGLRAAVRLPV
jgi:two-component system osmolarity sensor histidine kinase EnvZ